MANKNYWHLKQGMGRCFTPGQLKGYFNDLTGKVKWPGTVDDKNIPLNINSNKERVYFPTVIFQKALGHWDAWLESNKQHAAEYNEFLNIARWAVNNQDELGGWPVWPKVFKECASPYSAMPQGEAISLLVRAFSSTGDKTYLDCAYKSMKLLLKDIKNKGVSRPTSEGLILEEVPLETPNAVLNGWIFALFGLYDFYIASESPEAQEALKSTLRALVYNLPKYNAGFWSFYDFSGNLASPFYHDLHIAQLEALTTAFPEYAETFSSMRMVFKRQSASCFNRSKAIILKVFQKILHPSDAVIK